MVKNIKSRIPPSYLVILSILLVFAAMTILWYFGVISFNDIYANFFYIIFQLATITILAILGAIFLGMLLSHRILATEKGFSPLDLAIMDTNKNVKELRKEVELLRSEVEDLRTENEPEKKD